jgi:hypothetical protein
MRAMIVGEVIGSSAEGVSVTVETTRGLQVVVMAGENVLPVMPANGPESQVWAAVWLEHQALCPLCDKRRNPPCARAQEISQFMSQ